MNKTDEIGKLKGIGAKTETLFHKLGIYTVGELITYFPRTYDVFQAPVSIAELEEGEVMAVVGHITRRAEVNRTSRLQVVTASLKDGQSYLNLTWFRMPFLRAKLIPGNVYVFRGRVIMKKDVLVMEQPKIYTPFEYEQLRNIYQPIYTLTQGLTSNKIGKAIQTALEQLNIQEDYMPLSIRNSYGLAEYNESIYTMHFPKTMEELVFARTRLVFDEFLIFILMLKRLKEKKVVRKKNFQIQKTPVTERFIDNLPFKLTHAQVQVWHDIELDITEQKVMNRLIQGDVGSGKTILAILALILVAESGYQGALMVPTEILATQHYESFCALFAEQNLPYRPILLKGSMSTKEKREAYQKIRTNEADIIIGTHALIQDKVDYHQLALVITDEQHRFGVNQRSALSQKGFQPHVIVMSATPIPRTLAIILYGDLDISVIDELPKERLTIKNCVVDTSYRHKVYHFIQQEINLDRQAYIICPMVEESEYLEVENVIDYATNLYTIFPSDICIQYLHGKMKQSEKDEIMEAFIQNKIQILVSTTVIEVGVNVPNATVIMIENAERFGLAQLHQLRGRVGRGKYQSYCIFMSGVKNKAIKERLEILSRSNDGFYIAEEDLKQRGPGDLFGLRQSGLMDFKIGDVFQDSRILQMAKEASETLMDMLENKDPQVNRLADILDKDTKGGSMVANI